MQQAQAGERELDEHAFEAEVELAARIEPLLLPLEPDERVTAAATFTFHSGAITDSGRLLLWGDNSHGQLGIEASNKSELGSSLRAEPLSGGTFASALSLGEHHTVVLTNASAVLTFGHNERGKTETGTSTALPMPPTEPLAVASSAFFSAALDAAGHIFVWGDLPLARRTDRPR